MRTGGQSGLLIRIKWLASTYHFFQQADTTTRAIVLFRSDSISRTTANTDTATQALLSIRDIGAEGLGVIEG
ncbi:MAG: hypothetical protein B6D76_02810 [gamma proteobacterium symbiont of Stewartia floridana]|nr:MAG: hypothetical protein B6D76_02810 [gamma proteobacterium symbiont of Stewartia floridana]